jgi:hypothetical protein
LHFIFEPAEYPIYRRNWAARCDEYNVVMKST